MSEMKWVPCSERKPEEFEWIGTKRFKTTKSDQVIVTVEMKDGGRTVILTSFQNGGISHSLCGRFGGKAIAWMPLPEPYGEET